jgi:hypothetical protein
MSDWKDSSFLARQFVDRRGLVRGVAVEHQAEVQAFQDRMVDDLQELEELLVAVPAVGLGDDRSAGPRLIWVTGYAKTRAAVISHVK